MRSEVSAVWFCLCAGAFLAAQQSREERFFWYSAVVSSLTTILPGSPFASCNYALFESLFICRLHCKGHPLRPQPASQQPGKIIPLSKSITWVPNFHHCISLRHTACVGDKIPEMATVWRDKQMCYTTCKVDGTIHIHYKPWDCTFYSARHHCHTRRWKGDLKRKSWNEHSVS